MRGLKAVDLRDGARDDDRHCVGHIIVLQRLGDALVGDVGAQPQNVGIALVFGFFGLFFLWHWINLPYAIFGRCRAMPLCMLPCIENPVYRVQTEA